MIASTNVLVIC